MKITKEQKKHIITMYHTFGKVAAVRWLRNETSCLLSEALAEVKTVLNLNNVKKVEVGHNIGLARKILGHLQDPSWKLPDEDTHTIFRQLLKICEIMGIDNE